jgi:hypothetical protein
MIFRTLVTVWPLSEAGQPDRGRQARHRRPRRGPPTSADARPVPEEPTELEGQDVPKEGSQGLPPTHADRGREVPDDREFPARHLQSG